MTMLNGTDLSALSPDELIALVQNTQAKLDAIQAAKPKREPKEKTADQLAKEAARAAFEAIALDEPGTVTRLIQDADRFNQVDAVSKLVRALPWDRVARVAADLAAEVAEIESRDVFEVAGEAITRKARAKKSEAATVDEAVTQAADNESEDA